MQRSSVDAPKLLLVQTVLRVLYLLKKRWMGSLCYKWRLGVACCNMNGCGKVWKKGLP